MRYRKRTNGLLAVALVIAIPATAAGQAREQRISMSEREAVAVLTADHHTQEGWRGVSRALKLAERLGPDASPELRAAVIESAWVEVRAERMRRMGEAVPGSAGSDPDVLFMHFEAAEAFRDPRAIPLMIEALKYGGGVMDALADLGAAAFPATLAAVSDPGGHWSRIGCGLTALRFMVEDRSLNASQTGQVREVVRERLFAAQHSFVVNAAVRLALALDDPELRRTVERIATDRAFAEALVLDAFPLIAGSHDEDTNRVQERARLFLSARGADIGPFRRRHSPR